MSKFIIKKRGKGKTTDLVKISAEKREVIICKDKGRCYVVKAVAERLGCKIPEPMTIREALGTKGMGLLHGRSYMYDVGKVLIDDVDDVLGLLIGVPCEAITGSPDEDESNEN